MHARFKLTTRFETVQEFVVGFSGCDGGSMFLKTDRACVKGERCSVTIMLADKTSVLAGSWEVLDVFESTDNPFGARGIQVRIDRLSAESERVYARLLTARAPRKTSRLPIVTVPPRRVSTETGSVPRRIPTASGLTPARRLATVSIPPIETHDDRPIEALPLPLPLPPPLPEPPPVLAEGTTKTRAPEPSIVLPANPFTGLTDASLQGLVDGGLHEARPAPPPEPPAIAAPSELPRPRKRRLPWLAFALAAAAAAAAIGWNVYRDADAQLAVEPPPLVEVEPVAAPRVVEVAVNVAPPAAAATPARKPAIRRAPPHVVKKPDVERPPI